MTEIQFAILCAVIYSAAVAPKWLSAVFSAMFCLFILGRLMSS